MHLGLVVLELLGLLVFLDHQCRVQVGLLEQKGLKDKPACLANRD